MNKFYYDINYEVKNKSLNICEVFPDVVSPTRCAILATNTIHGMYFNTFNFDSINISSIFYSGISNDQIIIILDSLYEYLGLV